VPLQQGVTPERNAAKAAVLTLVLREALEHRLQPDFRATVTDGTFQGNLELELLVTGYHHIVAVNWRRPRRSMKQKSPTKLDSYAALAQMWGCTRDEAKERLLKAAYKNMPHAI